METVYFSIGCKPLQEFPNSIKDISYVVDYPIFCYDYNKSAKFCTIVIIITKSKNKLVVN